MPSSTPSQHLADNIIDIYQKHGDSFIRNRGYTLVERSWLDAFLNALPKNGRDVLDIGCGSGKPIAEYLIQHHCQLTGIDSNPAFIAMAQQSFSTHHWLTADMRALPPLKKFHGLLAWHSLFHLKPEDQRLMFQKFSDLTHPNGILMFTSGTVFGEAIGTFEGQALYHASFDTAQYHQLLEQHGFEVLNHVEDDPTCGHANIWLAKKSC